MDRSIKSEIVISVVIATYNRAKYLSKAIEGLINQTLEKSQYEILVVDNNSTDNTKQIVLDLMKAVPNLKYIYEAISGANNARNTGWKNAIGKYVAYLDDDAIPSHIWLERILFAFESVSPKPGIVGGKVIPIWESEKPSWVKGRLLKALSVVDYSEEARFLENKEFLYSVNMALQRELLARFQGFDVSLGRKGKRLTSNDEILIAIKIKNAGYKFYYDPLIAVEHLVPSNRLTHKWFFKRYYQQGYSDALMWMLLEKPSLWVWFKKFIYYIYGFVRNPTHIFYLLFKPAKAENIILTLLIYARIGFIKGLWQKNECKS